jgi:hypothetical protein
MLGGSAQDINSVVRRDSFAFDEDAFGDEFPRYQSNLKVFGRRSFSSRPGQRLRARRDT